MFISTVLHCTVTDTQSFAVHLGSLEEAGEAVLPVVHVPGHLTQQDQDLVLIRVLAQPLLQFTPGKL